MTYAIFACTEYRCISCIFRDVFAWYRGVLRGLINVLREAWPVTREMRILRTPACNGRNSGANRKASAAVVFWAKADYFARARCAQGTSAQEEGFNMPPYVGLKKLGNLAPFAKTLRASGG